MTIESVTTGKVAVVVVTIDKRTTLSFPCATVTIADRIRDAFSAGDYDVKGHNGLEYIITTEADIKDALIDYFPEMYDPPAPPTVETHEPPASPMVGTYDSIPEDAQPAFIMGMMAGLHNKAQLKPLKDDPLREAFMGASDAAKYYYGPFSGQLVIVDVNEACDGFQVEVFDGEISRGYEWIASRVIEH